MFVNVNFVLNLNIHFSSPFKISSLHRSKNHNWGISHSICSNRNSKTGISCSRERLLCVIVPTIKRGKTGNHIPFDRLK